MFTRPSSSLTRDSRASRGTSAGCFSSELMAARANSETLRVPQVEHNSRKRSYSSAVRRKLTILLFDSVNTRGELRTTWRAKEIWSRTLSDGGEPVAINFDGDGTLQHRYGDNHPRLVFLLDEDSLHSIEGTIRYPYPLTFAQIFTRLSRKP